MLLTVTEVAERLRVHRTQIYKLRESDSTFPAAVYVGNRSPRYREADIEAWLERQTAGPAPEGVAA